MRRGIPEEDWGSVITVYDDAESILAFTGNQKPNNGRVMLLNKDGKVLWFTDRGYSATQVKELDGLARTLAEPKP
jgi:hypothetical protein